MCVTIQETADLLNLNKEDAEIWPIFCKLSEGGLSKESVTMCFHRLRGFDYCSLIQSRCIHCLVITTDEPGQQFYVFWGCFWTNIETLEGVFQNNVTSDFVTENCLPNRLAYGHCRIHCIWGLKQEFLDLCCFSVFFNSSYC